MLKQVACYLLLIVFLAGTSRGEFPGNLFEPFYIYDGVDVVHDSAHRLRSPYEDSSVVVTTQKPTDSTSSTPPKILDKLAVKIELNSSAVSTVENIKSDQSEFKELKVIKGRHMSGLENYYQKLRNSFGYDTKYDFLVNLLQRRDEEAGHLASLMMSSRRIRSKKDESKKTTVMPVELVELRPTVNETLNEMDKNWSQSSSGIEYDIQGQPSVELMHKRHVLFVESRKQNQMNVLAGEADLSGILRQEADAMACGPRNYIRSRVANSTQEQQFDEFPSHAGLYATTSATNTTTNDMSFLCGATWFHERFVLTLASCLDHVELDQLTIRLGEWKIGRQNEEPAMVLSRVDKAYKFPHHMPDLPMSPHNLALLRLALPSSQLDYRRRLNYLTPACCAESRTMDQKSDCRAPGRRTTTSEYFDLDDGEYKMQNSVKMVEQTIEMKCYDSEVFITPNHMCLGDLESRSLLEQRNPEVDLSGSGVYCNESGMLRLKSMVVQYQNRTNLIDLTFYQPWLRNITLDNN